MRLSVRGTRRKRTEDDKKKKRIGGEQKAAVREVSKCIISGREGTK